MRPLDALQRPNAQANGVKDLRCVVGVYVDFMALGVAIKLVGSIHPGNMGYDQRSGLNTGRKLML